MTGSRAKAWNTLDKPESRKGLKTQKQCVYVKGIWEPDERAAYNQSLTV